jgi:hypothetical protein
VSALVLVSAVTMSALGLARKTGRFAAQPHLADPSPHHEAWLSRAGRQQVRRVEHR